MKKRGLGKGLDALISDNLLGNDVSDNDITKLPISEIEPNKNQPRRIFDQDKLSELAESIKSHGVIQPLVVRKLDNNRYQIIAGERRWRAARIASLLEIPVVIRDYSDKQVMEIALVENLQRENLNIIETAKGYKSLIDEFSLTQDEVANRMGKSRPVISNTLRILSLPDDVIFLLEQDKISSGHAKVLLSIEDKSKISEIANVCVENKLSVRELEKLIQRLNKGTLKKDVVQNNNLSDEYSLALKNAEKNLANKFGTKVNINSKKKGGKIEIEFYSSEQLEELLNILSL